MVTPTGLKPSALYTITLRVVCADNFKIQIYMNRRWHTVGTTDVTHETNRMAYQHPSTPAPGEQLNNKSINFKLMKITHNPKSKNGNVSTCNCYAPSHLHYCYADLTTHNAQILCASVH